MSSLKLARYPDSPAKTKPFDSRNTDTFGANATAWTPEDMFAANAKLGKVAPEDFRPCRFMKIIEVKEVQSQSSSPIPSHLHPKPVTPRSHSVSSRIATKPMTARARISDSKSNRFSYSLDPVCQSSIKAEVPKQSSSVSLPVSMVPTPISSKPPANTSKQLFQFRMEEILP